jgi:hypothetical protein
MGMPRQKPHRSKQDYGTPLELICAVNCRFGQLTWDLAATAENTVAPRRPGSGGFFSEGLDDALTTSWEVFTRADLLWLNPPFGAIATTWAPLVSRWTRKLPWLRVLMLTPGSIGSEWFQRYVHRKAMVLALSPRLHFIGAADPYPKDCMLSCFGFGVTGFDVWRWDAVPERADGAEPVPI